MTFIFFSNLGVANIKTNFSEKTISKEIDKIYNNYECPNINTTSIIKGNTESERILHIDSILLK